jgi:hypothetical protein
MLAAAAGLGAGAFARFTPASGQGAGAPILRRPIPHGGEMLPVVGLGTSQVFGIGSDAKERAERRAVLEALVAAGGSLWPKRGCATKCFSPPNARCETAPRRSPKCSNRCAS